MTKYTIGTYQTVYSCGGINININLIMCKDNIVILSILQSCVLHWHHTHLLRPRMDIT